MQRALGLAEGVRGHVWPNPPVGCVIVKDGAMIAEAATHPGGRPHAERQALDQAGAKAIGATLYVTLEPCCHWGQTPPCADAIIGAGVTRVVCTMQDPDPRVNGGGFARLRNAGVNVQVGLCADSAAQVISGFLHRVRTGEPELVITEHASATIPVGVDARLQSSERGLSLFTRRREAGRDIAITCSPDRRLLAQLADMGLTSVAVARSDPILRRLLVSQARATHTLDWLDTKMPTQAHT
jgi:diaminohydroxyphosphoribosylaminopyrimidine deaminase/5-amino-6-(5-phosphoribosylamino)uracil reductase